MIKTYISLILFCTITIQLKAQKNINLIILIDEKIVAGSLSNLRLIYTSERNTEESVKADYYPGNLSLNQNDYDMLLGKNLKTIYLAFTYNEYCKNKLHSYSYKIDLNNKWLENYYFVLYIFNTNKSKYKEIYSPIKGTTYTYEYDYPGGSVKRVKKNKNGCD